MSNQLTSVIMDTMKSNGYPMTVGVLEDIEDVLRLGFRGSQVNDAVKREVMIAGVKIFVEARVPEVVKPLHILEFSNEAKDFMLSLGIPGAAEAMKGQA